MGGVDRYAAVILAGGAGRRLGGPGKPALPVGDRSMLARVLDAVADAVPRVVVGSGMPDTGGVLRTCEEPPGGGPVAALAAGLRFVPAGTVAVLAADLPFLTRDAIAALTTALTSTVDGVVFVDGAGRRQLLCGLWYATALADRLAALGDPAGRSVRELVGGLRVAELSGTAPGPPPWYDCDTETDLRRAREWA